MTLHDDKRRIWKDQNYAELVKNFVNEYKSLFYEYVEEEYEAFLRSGGYK